MEARIDGFVQRWEARMGTGAQTGDTIYCVSVRGFDGMAELRASDLRALLKAYQEQRRALSGLLGFMGQLSSIDFVNALYWHETPGLELTTHQELVANLDEAIAAGFAALATRDALNQKGDDR
jgi:hypothetical protein